MPFVNAFAKFNTLHLKFAHDKETVHRNYNFFLIKSVCHGRNGIGKKKKKKSLTLLVISRATSTFTNCIYMSFTELCEYKNPLTLKEC